MDYDSPEGRQLLYKRGIQELFARATSAARGGRFKESEELYRLWLKYEPGNPYPKYGLGLLLLEQGRYEEGFALYEARLEIPELAVIPQMTKV
jgi:tetratricopeptide (TPR) repeat protein